MTHTLPYVPNSITLFEIKGNAEIPNRLRPRWIRPHWAGRKLHLCRQTRSLRLSPWVLLMSQPTCSSDPTRLASAQNCQSVPLPAFQLCVPALRPHAAHGGSHRENISSLFWLLEESQLQHSLLWQPGIFVTQNHAGIWLKG